jgi:hypothetical protein
MGVETPDKVAEEDGFGKEEESCCAEEIRKKEKSFQVEGDPRHP